MEDLTEIVCVVDRSGSMGSIKKEAIGGFNTFLETQQKMEGKANLTLAQFDDQYELLYDGVDVKDVKPYTDETYVPRGMTALLDAVGKTINAISQRTSGKDVSKKVLMSILTDGYENSSKEYSIETVKKMIEEKRALGWEFIFIGAGLDKIQTATIGGNIGINHTISVNHSGAGMRSAYASMSCAAASYRTSGDIGDINRGITNDAEDVFPFDTTKSGKSISESFIIKKRKQYSSWVSDPEEQVKVTWK